MRYTLPSHIILQTLATRRESAQLVADLPTGLPGVKAARQALIKVMEGQILSCAVIDARGYPLLQGEQALQALFHETVEWFVQPFIAEERGERPLTTTNPHVGVPPPPRQPTPLRNPRRLLPTVQAGWSHRQMQVFSLADGWRSVEEIATLLRLPPEAVREIVEQLRDLGALG
ncbi:MAG: hypothetical protein J2P37_26365 [Ktedonobacteraceae bacterium]|nr:hypothetical protein [Ktedonobacteraceae bacterium]